MPADVLVAIVRLYQRTISPLLGSHCRFLPSCSEYATIALSEWGALRGSWLTLRRLARCHPFHDARLDLPPRPPRAHVHAHADATSDGLIDGS